MYTRFTVSLFKFTEFLKPQNLFKNNEKKPNISVIYNLSGTIAPIDGQFSQIRPRFACVWWNASRHPAASYQPYPRRPGTAHPFSDVIYARIPTCRLRNQISRAPWYLAWWEPGHAATVLFLHSEGGRGEYHLLVIVFCSSWRNPFRLSVLICLVIRP